MLPCVGFRRVVPGVGEVVADREHPRDPAVLAADFLAQRDPPTRTRRSDEFRIPFSQRNLVDNSPRTGTQTRALLTRNSDVPDFFSADPSCYPG